MAITEDLVRKIAREEAVKAHSQVGWDIGSTEGASACVLDTRHLRQSRVKAELLPERTAKRRAVWLGWIMALCITLLGAFGGKLFDRLLGGH